MSRSWCFKVIAGVRQFVFFWIKYVTSRQMKPTILELIGTFRSEDEDDYEYEFSVLNMRIGFGGRNFSKCAYSEQKTRTRSSPVLRSKGP